MFKSYVDVVCIDIIRGLFRSYFQLNSRMLIWKRNNNNNNNNNYYYYYYYYYYIDDDEMMIMIVIIILEVEVFLLKWDASSLLWWSI